MRYITRNEVMRLGLIIGEYKNETFYVKDILFKDEYCTKGKAELLTRDISKIYIDLLKRKDKNTIIGLCHYVYNCSSYFLCETTVGSFYNNFIEDAVLITFGYNRLYHCFSNINRRRGLIITHRDEIYNGKL